MLIVWKRPVIWTKRFYPLWGRKNFQTKASQAQFHTHPFQVLFLTISLSFAKSFLKLQNRCEKDVYESSGQSTFIKQEDTVNLCHPEKTLLSFIRHMHFSVICACAMKSIFLLKADHSKGVYHLRAKQAANYMQHNHELQTSPCWSMDSVWPQISRQMVSQLDHRSPN